MVYPSFKAGGRPSWQGAFLSDFCFISGTATFTSAYHPRGESSCSLDWKKFWPDRDWRSYYGTLQAAADVFNSPCNCAIAAFAHNHFCLIGPAGGKETFSPTRIQPTFWFLQGTSASSRLDYCTAHFDATTQHDRGWLYNVQDNGYRVYPLLVSLRCCLRMGLPYPARLWFCFYVSAR